MMTEHAIATPQALERPVAEHIWKRWLEMWNEDPTIAHEIIAPSYRVHLPGTEITIDPATVTDPTAMEAWVRGFTSRFRDLHYETDFGPLVDGDRLAVRWYATGFFLGRTGWARDIPGDPVIFIGVDILRIVDGRIVDCWTQAKETLSIP
jgi:hypothetical protein